MAVKPTDPPRERTPWLWAGGVLLLGALVAGLLGAAVLLWRVVDVDAVLEAAEREPPPAVEAPLAELRLPELTRTLPWTAYIYESEPTAEFFPDGDYYAELIARWAALLRSVGAEVERLSDASAIAALSAGDLLVMPAAVCLADDERDALWDHIDGGGHLLATWAIGVRDGECEWVGYRLLLDIAEAKAAGTIEERSPTYMTLPRGSALAAGLAPGHRLELKTEPWVALRTEAADAFWSDYALNPVALPEGGAAGAAITRVADSGARIAWFGYRVDVGARQRDRRLVHRLAENAALWTAGHLLADVEPWPDGYGSAMAVTMDVEQNFRNSRRLANRFKELDVPVTFFVVTQLALEHPELAELLRSAGELGTHSVDHRQVAGRPFSTQLAGLARARQDVAGWAGVDPLGFRPPRELFDAATLEAWRQVGGLYLAAGTEGRSAAPEIFDTPAGPVVVLPRVVDDDYAVMIARGQTSPDSLREALGSAVEKMRWLGGLNFVSLHSQLIESNRRVNPVEAAVSSAREAGDVWIAPAWQLADWWLNRSALELQVRERADRSAVLTVRNRGRRAVTAARIQLHLSEDASTYAAPELGESIVESEYCEGGLRITLPDLPPGHSVHILLPRRLAS